MITAEENDRRMFYNLKSNKLYRFGFSGIKSGGFILNPKQIPIFEPNRA